MPPDHLVFDGRLHFDVDDRGDVQGYTGGTVESPEADLLGVIGYNLRLTQPLGNRTQGFCDNGIETTTHQITLVCPSDLTWMENTTDAVFVEGFIDGIYPIQTNLTGVRPGTDVYQNNETPGDVNIGINWSLDTFRQGSGYALGLTTNDGTNFQSGPFDGAIGFLSFAFDLPVSGFLIDADAIPEGLSELRFSIVDSGFNSDKLPLSIDLINFGTLLIGDSPVATTPPPTTPAPTTTAAPTITPAPTPAEPATTPTTPFSTSPPAPPPATATPTAGDDGGGSGGGVTIIIGGLIIAIASFGVYLYSRRRAGKDCEPEERAYALARARVMNTETKRQVADANLADARSRRGALTGQMTTPSPPHRTEFSGASDDPDFLQALEAHAAVAARSEAARAQAAAIDAEIATGEASLRDAMAEHDAAIDAENEARLALDACLAGRTDGSSSSSGGSAASVGGTTTRPGGGSGSTAGDGTETGGGTPEGGGQSGPSAPAIVDQPETTEPKECEPEGKEEVRPEPGADSVVFAISAGNVLIRISGSSTQWAEFVRANGGTIGPARVPLSIPGRSPV